MRLTDAVSYVLFAITISASCVTAEKQHQIEESQPDRRIQKRDATVLVENFPYERFVQKPKMVYRRLSKQRYIQPKAKYGPVKSKYGPKPRRSPPKKYRAKSYPPKRAMSGYKTRPSKPRYPQSQKHKPAYRPPKKAPMYSYFSPVPSGFGEPPSPMRYEYRPKKQSYAEPPVDSYDELIKPVVEDIYPTAPDYQITTGYLDNQDFNIRPEYQSWMEFVPAQSPDTVYEFSKKVPVIVRPKTQEHVTPATNEYYDEPNIDTEDNRQKQNSYGQKKKHLSSGNTKVVKKPWKIPKKPETGEEIIVGGQYAEPPGRVVQSFHPHSPMYEDDEEFAPRHHFVGVPSATSTPYVNYKNSNMAFSPQNLNDAFSIVDK